MNTGKNKQHLPIKLAAPAHRALTAAGLNTFEDIAALHERQLQELHGLGPNSIRLIKEALAERGLSLSGPAGKK